MADVIHRVTLAQQFSVNTPDFPAGSWIINPDLSALAGVEKKYWKVSGDSVLEMSQAEKDAADAGDLPAAKRSKCAAVDAKTRELIALGFTHAGTTLSLSSAAQSYWVGAYAGRELLTATGSFPLRVNALNDESTYDVLDEADLTALYGAAVGTVKAHLGSGTAVKDLVRAATTVSGVNAVDDPR